MVGRASSGGDGDEHLERRESARARPHRALHTQQRLFVALALVGATTEQCAVLSTRRDVNGGVRDVGGENREPRQKILTSICHFKASRLTAQASVTLRVLAPAQMAVRRKLSAVLWDEAQLARRAVEHQQVERSRGKHREGGWRAPPLRPPPLSTPRRGEGGKDEGNHSRSPSKEPLPKLPAHPPARPPAATISQHRPLPSAAVPPQGGRRRAPSSRMVRTHPP